jgi:uncharacterized membrane protein
MISLSPYEKFLQALRWWWVILLLAVLGAGIGLFISRLNPVQYESTAVVSVGINFVMTGELTDEQQDQTMQGINDFLTSEEVMIPVFGDTLPETWVFRQPFDAERQGYHFLLNVRGPDQDETSRLASAWAEQAAAALQQSVHHAEIADALQYQANSLVQCLESMAAIPPVYVPCENQSVDEVRVQLDELYTAVDEERLASHGILSTAQITYNPQTPLTTRVVRYGQNYLILGGALIGLLAALTLVTSGWLEKLTGKRHA